MEEGEFTFALNGILFGESVFAFDLLFKLTGKKLIKSIQKTIWTFKTAYTKKIKAEVRNNEGPRTS